MRIKILLLDTERVQEMLAAAEEESDCCAIAKI